MPGALIGSTSGILRRRNNPWLIALQRNDSAVTEAVFAAIFGYRLPWKSMLDLLIALSKPVSSTSRMRGMRMPWRLSLRVSRGNIVLEKISVTPLRPWGHTLAQDG